MRLETLLRRGRRIRTLGVDDGPFLRGARADVLVVGAVYSAEQFEGLLSTKVRPDGFNSTDRLVRMIVGSKFHRQLHLLMLDGITLGGFNVVDLPALAATTGIPVVAVTRRRPNLAAVTAALARLSSVQRRERILRRAGPFHRVGSLSYQVAGLEPVLAGELIRRSVVQGLLPECLRAAHLIASGLVTGESGHRA
jgi:endonuclease V-like protein UPF0215 family